MGGLKTIQHSSGVRRQFNFFTSPSMLCATCGGAILVLNFLTLCIFSSKLLHLHFPNIDLLCEPVCFSCIFPIFSFCAHQAMTRSLNAELGLLLPSTRQYLRWNLSTRKYFKLFLSRSYKIELIGIFKIAHYF